MKQLLMLVMAAVMCFSFAACDNTMDDETIPSSIPDDSLTDLIEPGPPVSPDNLDELFIKRLLGQWMLTYDVVGVPLEMHFNEDKTCTVDGVAYIWQIKKADGPCGTVEVLDGSVVVYEFSYGVHNDGECAMLYYTDANWSVYLNPAHYDVIEITAENWLDYFEVTRSFYWKENAFGEVEALRSCIYKLALKKSTHKGYLCCRRVVID